MSNQTVLDIQNLRFRWPSGQCDVLDIPALKVDQGERVFVKGESGSGKTTLLGLVAGIVTPDHGQVEVLGVDIGALKQTERDQFRANHIGFIFQLFNLIPYLSVIENITLACRFSRLREKRALESSDSLENEARRLLAQLQLDNPALIRKPVNELSVGQQQRVAVARALIGSPELIVADEPTSALDAETRELFIRLLLKECERVRASVLFVSHDSALEREFDRTIDLKQLNKANVSRLKSIPEGLK